MSKNEASSRDLELRPLSRNRTSSSLPIRKSSTASKHSISEPEEGGNGGGSDAQQNSSDKSSLLNTLCSPCLDILRKDRYELAEELKDALISSIPPSSVDSDDLERTGYALHIAVVVQVTFLFFLLYIGVTDFQYNKKAEFLSPSLSEGDCEIVPVSIRSGYFADKYGYWDSEPQYVPSTTMHNIYFSGIIISQSQYTNNMEYFKASFQDVAERGAQRDLAYTLTALGAHQSYAPMNAMGARYDVVPEILLDYPAAEFGISDVNGNCVPFGDTPLTAYFDRSSRQFIFRIKAFNGTEGAQPCPQISIESFMFNKYSYDSSGMTDIVFDVRSVITAIAVNRGILHIKDLRPITSYQYNDTLYTNQAYSDMDPIYCIPGPPGTDSEQCFLLSASYYPLYPTMAQYGSVDGAIPCSCPYDPSVFIYGECDINNLLISFIYFERADSNTTIFDFAAVMAKYRIDDPEFGDVNATEVVRKAHISSLPISSLESRKETYKNMCGGFNCSLFHIQLIGELAHNTVNQIGTQLAEYFSDRNPGACKDALYHADALEPLLTKTPVPLHESYYVCRTPVMTAFQRAVGVASGSASLYSSIALSMLLFFAVRSFNVRNQSDPIVDLDEKRRRAETRVSQIEITVASLSNELSVLAQKYSDLADVNAKLVRQNEDLTKALVQVRNDVIGVKVDVARS